MADGLAIYDVMEQVESPVHTLCTGMAASMAQFLLSAGSRRFAVPEARVMMHAPEAHLAIHPEHMLYLKRQMIKMLVQFTGQPLSRIVFDMGEDKWFTATEALEYGFIDEVVGDHLG